MSLPQRVTVVEVGPRDGLQNKASPLSVEDRVSFCQRLLEAGLPVVEVGAFVSPRWVPQMAGSDEVFRRLAAPNGARVPVLVPNRRGFDLAREAGVRAIAVFTAASETFNRKNINASIDESFARFAEFVPEAGRDGMWVRGYISTCFGCPYEGRVPPVRVREVARRLLDSGCHEISVGDTIGVAVPSQVAEVAGLLKEALPAPALAVHLHDTRGTALANVLAALEEGITVVDSSAGGLGGCPYAPGAGGERQPGHRRPPLHAARHGHRDRRRHRSRGRRLAGDRPPSRPRAPQPVPPGLLRPRRPLILWRGARNASRRLLEWRPPVMDPSTLLVVDDNPANRELLSRRLERKGFSVLEADGGRRALDILSKLHVDLILLDIMMPGITGLEVLRQVRKTRSAAELPVIMVTARADSEDIVEALGLGANDYVTKPIDFPVVLARVQAHLRTRRAATTAAPVGPGAVLAGRYRLESKIGGGNFGVVYRATHLELDRQVAVKVLSAGVGTDPESLARFRREGISACRVKHPNAVSVLDFAATDGGLAYLVMELLEGCSLEQELRARGPLPPPRCAEVLVPVCGALAAAHGSRILHRDVKPANIFLHRTAQGEVPKVLDFGIASIVGESAVAQSLTLDGTLVGTPAYMAPERFEGQAYGPPSDVYSLGVSLFELLTGRLPFMPEKRDPVALAMMHASQPPPSLAALNPRVGPSLEAVVREALRKLPEQRPTAQEMGADLTAAVARDAAR